MKERWDHTFCHKDTKQMQQTFWHPFKHKGTSQVSLWQIHLVSEQSHTPTTASKSDSNVLVCTMDIKTGMSNKALMEQQSSFIYFTFSEVIHNTIFVHRLDKALTFPLLLACALIIKPKMSTSPNNLCVLWPTHLYRFCDLVQGLLRLQV